VSLVSLYSVRCWGDACATLTCIRIIIIYIIRGIYIIYIIRIIRIIRIIHRTGDACVAPAQCYFFTLLMISSAADFGTSS